MRILVVSMLVVALGGASARAASFGAPETIGTGATLATAAVAGGDGTFAFIARQQGGIVGGVRRGTGSRWETRALATGRAFSLRDPQIVIDANGTATALWTAELPHPALVAARARAGAGFGAAHVVAKLNNASGARPRMVALPSGHVLVTFTDRPILRSRILSSHARLKTVQLDHGRPSVVRDLGVEGAYPAVTRAGGRAMLVYVAGAPRCRRYVCAPRAVRATLLDAAGRRSGPTVTVADDGGTYFYPPRVTSAGSRAVVTWIRPGRGSASPPRAFTREYSTRPLRELAGARPFPIYGGPGVGTPSVAILQNGDLLGANVSNAAADEPVGGKAELSFAPRGGAWRTPTSLSSSAGMTTVPRVTTVSGGRALAVFARSRAEPGPAAYDVIAVERSTTGALSQTTLGSFLSSNDARGLSSSVAADGQVIVTWPRTSGGIDVVLGT